MKKVVGRPRDSKVEDAALLQTDSEMVRGQRVETLATLVVHTITPNSSPGYTAADTGCVAREALRDLGEELTLLSNALAHASGSDVRRAVVRLATRTTAAAELLDRLYMARAVAEYDDELARTRSTKKRKAALAPKVPTSNVIDLAERLAKELARSPEDGS